MKPLWDGLKRSMGAVCSESVYTAGKRKSGLGSVVSVYRKHVHLENTYGAVPQDRLAAQDVFSRKIFLPSSPMSMWIRVAVWGYRSPEPGAYRHPRRICRRSAHRARIPASRRAPRLSSRFRVPWGTSPARRASCRLCRPAPLRRCRTYRRR